MEQYEDLIGVDEPRIEYQTGVNNLRYHYVSREELGESQIKDPIWGRVREWVEKGEAPSLEEVRGGEVELILARGLFGSDNFIIKDGVLIFRRKVDKMRNEEGDRVCLPEEKLREGFNLCHTHTLAGHRGITGTLDKFLKSFFVFSAKKKIQDMVTECDQCLAKIKSLPGHQGVHVNRCVGSVGEKTFIDLVTMGATPRGNRYLVTCQDGFSRYASAYPIPDKSAQTVAKVLVQEHIPIHGVPQQLHSDNGGEFVNQVWAEIMREMDILHTVTPPLQPFL